MLKIVLKKGKEQSLLRFHPWVFSGAISSIITSDNKVIKMRGGEENIRVQLLNYVGQEARVYSYDNNFLAIGNFNIGSIMVRILTFKDEKIDSIFWMNKIERAYTLRLKSNLINSSLTNCYRLIHGEGDSISGLIVDIYSQVAVIQVHSPALYNYLDDIKKSLISLYGEKLQAIYLKGTNLNRSEEDDRYLYQSENYTPANNNIVLENGIKFNINWIQGQKTGFFLDQRENRKLVESFSSNKSVLNLFCYTGGFSLYALKGGAKFVDSVDSSLFATESLKSNLILNNFDIESNKAFCQDAIEYLRNVNVGKYDLIIVDPPAFAKHLSAKENALRAYRKLNALAINKVASGGFVFTFSCSQVVDKYDFALSVFSAAAQSERNVKILARLSQPIDHPVSIYHPEGEYLKGLLLYVE